MYEPLKLPASASLSQVEAAYDKFFAAVPATILRRTAIRETGIEARAGACLDPPDLTATGKLDEVILYNWFTAGCPAASPASSRRPALRPGAPAAAAPARLVIHARRNRVVPAVPRRRAQRRL
ncbi:MAG TPA: hypothetical protein VHZ03_54770 [Trebonia sp.]|nr:hypothetical protein [Trebonia sp.]